MADTFNGTVAQNTIKEKEVFDRSVLFRDGANHILSQNAAHNSTDRTKLAKDMAWPTLVLYYVFVESKSFYDFFFE